MDNETGERVDRTTIAVVCEATYEGALQGALVGLVDAMKHAEKIPGAENRDTVLQVRVRHIDAREKPDANNPLWAVEVTFDLPKSGKWKPGSLNAKQ